MIKQLQKFAFFKILVGGRSYQTATRRRFSLRH